MSKIFTAPVEYLDSYTREEIAAELALWRAALEEKEAWSRLSETEKDRVAALQGR